MDMNIRRRRGRRVGVRVIVDIGMGLRYIAVLYGGEDEVMKL